MLVILLALYFLAFVFSLAIYLSKGVGGSESLNSMRFIRTSAWGLASWLTVAWILEGHDTIHSPMALVLAMLAFSEIASCVMRFSSLLDAEGRTPHNWPALHQDK